MTNNMTTGTMGDKEILSDLLSSQKFTASNCNIWAGECKCTQLRDDFLQILNDEHMIQSDLFNEMSSRGWYPTKDAPQNEVTMTLNKLQGS